MDVEQQGRTTPRVAIVTGASLGLGRALATALAARGWSLVVDARHPGPLADLASRLPAGSCTAVPGDVADPEHRARLVQAARERGRLDLLVNNASELGPSPQPLLRDYPPEQLRRVYEVDVLAPLDLIRACLPLLASSAGVVVNVSSDAAVEAYPGWGGYGSAKAALDHASAVLAAEEPGLAVYAFDPGDMRTDMQQRAFPDEDISDRAEPASVVPALLSLVDGRPGSGRYRAADLAEMRAGAGSTR